MTYSAYLQAAILAISASIVVASPAPNTWGSNAPHELEKRVKGDMPMLPLYFPDNSECTQDQQVTIIKAFQNVLDMIDNVLDTATPNSLSFRTFFDNKQDGKAFGESPNLNAQQTAEMKEAAEFPEPEDTDGADQLAAAGGAGGAAGGASKEPDLYAQSVLPVVKAAFNEMKSFLTTTGKLQVTCLNKGDCKGSLLGLVPSNVRAEAFKKETPRKRINICPTFFSKGVEYSQLVCKNGQLDYRTAGMSGPADIESLFLLRERLLIHELSHLTTPSPSKVAEVVDCYYNAYSAEFLATWNPAIAVTNADNYGWFALAQHLATICGPNQPNNRDYFRSWNDVGSGRGIFKVGHFGEQYKESKEAMMYYAPLLLQLNDPDQPLTPEQEAAVKQKIQKKMQASEKKSPDNIFNRCKSIKMFSEYPSFDTITALMNGRPGNRA